MLFVSTAATSDVQSSTTAGGKDFSVNYESQQHRSPVSGTYAIRTP